MIIRSNVIPDPIDNVVPDLINNVVPDLINNVIPDLINDVIPDLIRNPLLPLRKSKMGPGFGAWKHFMSWERMDARNDPVRGD